MCERSNIQIDHSFLLGPVCFSKKPHITKTCIIYKIINIDVQIINLIVHFICRTNKRKVLLNCMNRDTESLLKVDFNLIQFFLVSGNQDKVISFFGMYSGQFIPYPSCCSCY